MRSSSGFAESLIHPNTKEFPARFAIQILTRSRLAQLLKEFPVWMPISEFDKLSTPTKKLFKYDPENTLYL